MGAASDPPANRLWWRRAAHFGGTGAVLAVLAVAVQLLFADIPSGRAFSKFSPTGWVPLWPVVLFFGVGLPLAGAVVGLSLPLLRYRHGEYAVSCLGVGTLAAVFAATRWGSLPAPFTLGWVQNFALTIFLFLTGLVLARHERAAALGEAAAPSDATESKPPAI